MIQHMPQVSSYAYSFTDKLDKDTVKFCLFFIFEFLKQCIVSNAPLVCPSSSEILDTTNWIYCFHVLEMMPASTPGLGRFQPGTGQNSEVGSNSD